MSFSMGAMRLLLGCVASLFAVTSAHSATRRLQAWALPLYLEQLTLTNNQIVEYKTSATTGGADPILYLLRASGTSWVQVAVNDNYTALEARVQHQNTTGSTQNYLLVLRTKNTSFGTTTLIRDGGSGQSGIAVGGQVVAASSLLFNSSDQIRTRHVPGRSVEHAIFALTTSDGLTIGKLAYMNAPGDAANISSIGTGVSSFLVGTPNLKTATTYDTPRSGAVDLYANDIGSDIDGDGVGDALETFLGLCKQAATCQFNYLPTDSDRDGLTDGEELWGVAGTRPDGADDVPFGRWGADPSRKDAFVEVDYAFDAAGPMTPGVNPFQYMRTNPGSWSWTLQPPTATVESWADAVRAPYLAAPGSHIKNLGTTPPAGLQIHLDLGVPPLNSDDEAKFGDYGSKSSRCLVKDWIIDFKATTSANIQLRTTDPLNTNDIQTGPVIATTGLSPANAALATAFNIPSGHVQFFRLENPPVQGLPAGAARLRIQTSRPCQDFTPNVLDNGADPNIATNIVSV